MNDGTPSAPDEMFELLADRHRRYVLASLRDASTPVPLADLATELARVESGSDAGGMDRRQLLIRLYHVHVPKLADAGLIEYHRERNTVELSADDEAIEAIEAVAQLFPEIREPVATTASE